MNGINCPDHPRARLLVVTVRRAAPGIVIRYRKCEFCAYRVPTEERPRAVRVVHHAGKRTTR